MVFIDKQFETLWDEFSNDLRRYIQSKVGNTHDAEDILQEVFIKIYKNLDALHEKAALKSWIFTITKNSIIDFYKKRKDVLVSNDNLSDIADEVHIEDVDIEENMNSEISECLKQMIFDIPEKYKAVYELYEKKNMKHKEIVEELDISLSTSKVRLMRAKELFKKNLVECCDFELDTYGNIISYSNKGNFCESCSGSNKSNKC